MKKFSLLNLLLVTILLIVVISCSKDETSATDDDNVLVGGKTLTGEYTSDITLATGLVYTVKGKAIFKEGTQLVIEPGVTINGDASVISYILIEQGAKIMAEGTADNPIIMTSTTPVSGAWGGLHICGKAPINVEGGTGESEIGGATYGGTDPNDNSGTIKYVRLEYTGVALDDEHESNGISFYGVGAETIVEHVQVYMGNDDGIEFFGGTVNIKWVVSTGSADDSFDWTEGWSGKAQYILAIQSEGLGDRGIEGDNNGNNNTATPYATPVFSQVTLIGGWAGTDKGRYGMKLREGTKGEFVNLVVTGFDKRSIHVEHNQTLKNVADNTLNVDYAVVDTNVSDAAIKYSVSKIDNPDYDPNDPESEEEIDDPSQEAQDAKDAAKANGFELSTNVKLTTVVADPAITYNGGLDAASLGSFFSSDSQIGSGNDWTVGWTK